MKLVVILLLGSLLKAHLVLACCKCHKQDSGNQSSILGPSPIVDAADHEWPELVSIQRNESGSMTNTCAGTVLNEVTILTAAHCVCDEQEGCTHESDLRVVIGQANLTESIPKKYIFEVKSILLHPDWQNDTTKGADIALLRLASKIPLKELDCEVCEVCLPKNSNGQPKQCVGLGWGVTIHGKTEFTSNLHKTSMSIESDEACSQDYPDYNGTTQLCASYPAIKLNRMCPDASGGPLMCEMADGRVVQFGITSYVHTVDQLRCKPVPVVFTRVNEYIDWIEANSKREEPKVPELAYCRPCPGGKSSLLDLARIIGGHDSKEGEWPEMASLQTTAENDTTYCRSGYCHICGGTVLNEDTILTAAHCVCMQPDCAHKYIEPDQFRVVLGHSKLTEKIGWEHVFEVKRVIIHPDFILEKFYLGFDIALIKLARKIRGLGSKVCKACLPMDLSSYQLSSAQCKAVGWGISKYINGTPHLNIEALQQVRLPLQSDAKCSEKLNLPNETVQFFNATLQVCAGYLSGSDGKGSLCEGDSGGPLMCPDHSGTMLQLGIASNVEADPNTNQCIPDVAVFTKVAYFIDWIKQNMEEDKEKQKTGQDNSGIFQQFAQKFVNRFKQNISTK